MFPSDILTIASKLVKITNEQTITLSTAESCTGGLIAGAITEIPGSSSIFHRGFVTYSNLAKQQVLNVPSHQLKKFGGNISKTAKFVGMERSALHRKLKLLGVKDLN